MNTKKQALLTYLILLSIFSASCSLNQPFASVTATATTTPTVLPTTTFTPSPTFTPTATLSPTPSMTPAPAIGDTLRSENWEATIVQITYRKSFSIAGTVYAEKPGYMGFDVIVKVKNLNPASNPDTHVENDVVIDEYGNSKLAVCWGAHDVDEVQGKDLLELTFVGCQTGNIYVMKIEDESYLRFHFVIEDTNMGKTIFFKFEDLPALPFTVNASEP